MRVIDAGAGADSDAPATRSAAASGAIVFRAGSFRLSSAIEHGLLPGEVDGRLQEFLRAALTDLRRDRRIDARVAAERELARLAGQVEATDRLAPGVETPVRAGATAIWPALADMLVGSRARTSTAIAPWDRSFTGGLETYLHAGQSALWNIARALAGAGMAAPSAILDLPCGTGRVTRSLRAAWPAAELVAADVSDPAISFCARHFAAAPWRLDDYVRLDASLHQGRYDLIWCGALLSQMLPERTSSCLSSLLALLAPNGVLVAGYHGRDSARRMQSSDDPGVQGLAGSLAERGFGFHARQDGSGLGLAVLSPQWLAAAVTAHRGAMLLSLTERGWLDHLDVVAVMRKDVHHPHGNLELQ